MNARSVQGAARSSNQRWSEPSIWISSPKCSRSLQQPMGLPRGDPHRAAPEHQSDSALACSSAPHPSDPQPPNFTTKRERTDIPTLLSADILALRLHPCFADPMLWNVAVRLATIGAN